MPVSCIRRQQRRVAGTRTRGPVHVSHGCTHPCIQACAAMGRERVSSRVPMGFQNRPSFVAFGFDTCCSACTPSSRAAGSVYRATIEPRFREIVRDVCALRVWGSRRYLTQSRHLDLRCGMAMTGLVEFEVISYGQAVEKISLFRGIFWPLLFVMKV